VGCIRCPHFDTRMAADSHTLLKGEASAPAVEWVVGQGLVPYEPASTFMVERSDAIAAGSAPELVWLIEHPPLYTAGTSARPGDLLQPGRFPVHATGRGGQFTYHGPGQRVVYVMLDVKRRFGDVRAYVHALETWAIEALAELGIEARTIEGRVGVWVRQEVAGQTRHDKIAAIGVRLRRWVSSHGLSLNVDPDLDHFAGIVPCGIRDDGVTSLAALGHRVPIKTVDEALRRVFERRFAPARDGVTSALRGEGGASAA
jgi:lipoyl(octanoyl) transferase